MFLKEVEVNECFEYLSNFEIYKRGEIKKPTFVDTQGNKLFWVSTYPSFWCKETTDDNTIVAYINCLREYAPQCSKIERFFVLNLVDKIYGCDYDNVDNYLNNVRECKLLSVYGNSMVYDELSPTECTYSVGDKIYTCEIIQNDEWYNLSVYRESGELVYACTSTDSNKMTSLRSYASFLAMFEI